ncbi:hypothetical protein QJS66_05915 [Kocuria rhizophila]|nr:hypothetical protein QJS66_05915 [Kocuria rhizophila]
MRHHDGAPSPSSARTSRARVGCVTSRGLADLRAQRPTPSWSRTSWWRAAARGSPQAALETLAVVAYLQPVSRSPVCRDPWRERGRRGAHPGAARPALGPRAGRSRPAPSCTPPPPFLEKLGLGWLGRAAGTSHRCCRNRPTRRDRGLNNAWLHHTATHPAAERPRSPGPRRGLQGRAQGRLPLRTGQRRAPATPPRGGGCQGPRREGSGARRGKGPAGKGAGQAQGRCRPEGPARSPAPSRAWTSTSAAPRRYGARPAPAGRRPDPPVDRWRSTTRTACGCRTVAGHSGEPPRVRGDDPGRPRERGGGDDRGLGVRVDPRCRPCTWTACASRRRERVLRVDSSNKPAGVVSTMEDPQRRRCVSDYLDPRKHQRVFTWGALRGDRGSSRC